MERKVLNQITWGLSLLILPVFFNGCSADIEFEELPIEEVILKSGEKNPAGDGWGNINDPGSTVDLMPTNRTEIFSSKVMKAEGKVDLIWVVDNSGSMSQEAEIVRDNLSAFIDYVKQRSDLKFKLISAAGSNSTLVELPVAADSQFSQINRSVGSWNGLTLLSDYIENGELSSFFRPSALKYVVMVTDDNSEMGAQTFLNKFKNVHPNSEITVSGFIGLGSSQSPCQAAKGDEYLDLKNKTNGYMFNICDEDWSQHFSDLADHVTLSANNRFNLSASEVLKVHEVRINGEAIDSSWVKLTGRKVTIDFPIEEFGSVDNLNIEIDYLGL